MKYEFRKEYKNYTIRVIYKNNPNRPSDYKKRYSDESYAIDYCNRKLMSNKVLDCFILRTPKKEVVKKQVFKESLIALDKPFFFRDKAGYKYYIRNNERVKSSKPVFDPIP